MAPESLGEGSFRVEGRSFGAGSVVSESRGSVVSDPLGTRSVGQLAARRPEVALS